MMRILSFRRSWFLGLTIFLLASPVLASHFRGGNVNAQVTEDGVVTLTYEALWRKGGAFFPFDGVDRVLLYAPSDVSRSSLLRSLSVNIGNTTVFRDVSDPAFDFRIQVITFSLPALGLPQGRYIARFQDCCRIRGIQNAPESWYSLEALIDFDGTANGSPVLNSRILTVVGKGLPYDQNLNAFDPEGRPLTYDWVIGSSRPNRGPSFNIPGITLGGTGQIFISPFDTANLEDFNPWNPAGDYVFKVRVTDADGAFSERDVLLDVVATANLPPEIVPIGNRVIDVGESLVLPVVADDPNVIDRVTLSTSALPANTVLVTTPGNPATGTLAFRPDATQVGIFGINIEAADDGSPILTDSELLTITVLDPANTCPVLGAVGNRDVPPGETLTFTLAGADPDAGQTLSFSAAFLPPGASFDPLTATFSWTPGVADAGVYLGTVFEVRDSSSPPCADREVVGFTVQPANRFPVLDEIGERTVTEGAMVFFTAAGSDPDGDAVSLAAQPLPTGASFDPETGEFMWTPTIGQAGTYEITFSATDDGDPSLSDRETVRVVVAASGEEAIRFVGVAEEQTVSGLILVEVQVVGALPVQSVDFTIDGQPVNTDAAAPYFLGGEQDGLPLGFDTLTVSDGLHVIEAEALDSAGQTNTAQRKIVVRNIVPPEIVDVDGLFDGAVVSETIIVEVEASDDQQVSTVEFQIDGETVNVGTGTHTFLGGGFLPAGTFDVSCRVCLQAGDRDDDLVVVAIDEDGTLADLCAGGSNLTGGGSLGGGLTKPRVKGNGTPDGDPPSDEDVCDVFRGNNGPAFGLCNAFCEAQDCDGPGYRETPCEQLRENFIAHTDESRFPCEGGGDCISALTLGWVGNPSRLATFGPEDFNGAQTRFQLPFEVPLGFDTTTLANGEHTLTVIVTDNLGLETTVEIVFIVDNAPPPADALKVTITSPVDGESFEQGRVVPLTAAIADAQGPVTVRFYADSDLVTEDTEAPYETAVLVPAGTAALTLEAIAIDDRRPRAAAPVEVAVASRPVEPPPIELVTAQAELVRDGRVAVDSRLLLIFSRPVDPATLDGIRLASLELDGGAIPLGAILEDDGSVVIAAPTTPLAPDALHVLVVDGVAAPDGARAPRQTRRFVTFPDIALAVGQVLAADLEPLAGMEVRIGEVAGSTDADGIFRLEDVPTGEQHLEVGGGEIGGRTYPPLAFPLTVAAGAAPNQLPQPVMLVALDLAGGIDVVDGQAVSGGGILTSSELPGMALDLSAATVRHADGTLFTGRMSITEVPGFAVPMEAPAGTGSSLYITVQPGSLHLDPPAPIVYPNLDNALPGEVVPLMHFDHDADDWVIYGNGTVSADGSVIASDAGVGLPKTGWGTPLPPPTFTTVKGRVVDAEGSPLHGVMVSSGNVRRTTDQEGNFEIPGVFAGREGQPKDIGVVAVARDIEIRRFFALSQVVTANQNGDTSVGDVQIDDYAPVISGRIHLHGDYRPLGGQDHFLQRRYAPHNGGERRYEREVEEVQRRLREMGFRQGGGEGSVGMPLEADGIFGEGSWRAVRLFQAIELANGAAGQPQNCSLCTGIVDRDSLEEVNEIPNGIVLWRNVGAESLADHPCPNEPGDGFGVPDLGDLLRNANGDAAVAGLGNIPINDISVPNGARYDRHGSHQVGIDVDVPLPRISTGNGCNGWGGGVIIGHATAGVDYDRDAARSMIQAWSRQPGTSLIYLGDQVLCNTEMICTFDNGHRNHFHLRIDPRVAPGVANDFGKNLEDPIHGVSAAGATSPDDIPIDGTLVVSFVVPFDSATLNASTILLEGPAGPVQGEVVADAGGWAARFTPAAALDFATPYTLTLTSGAVLADGRLLAEPAQRTVTTEPTVSLRVVRTQPAETSEVVPVDTEVTVRFDDPVNPATLTAASVQLVNRTTELADPIRLRLSDDRTLLTIESEDPLADITYYTLVMTSAVRGEDGSPLVGEPDRVAFPTGLPPGLERVEVEPREIEITRADLSDRFLTVTGFFADGTVRDLSVQETSGTIYTVDPVRTVVAVRPEGLVDPLGNGDALVNVLPLLEGFEAPVRVRVVGVFPDVRVLGRQFDLRAEDDIVLEFSEPVDGSPLAVLNTELRSTSGTVFPGSSQISSDGLTLVFDPDGLLLPRTDLTLRYDLEITDDNGLTRTFPQALPLATAAVNLGFELGDLTGFAAEGDVEVVQGFGPLSAPEGQFMARLITSDLAVGGSLSRLEALDLEVPVGAQSLVFTYNFFTDEIEQGNPFNDFFRATLVLPDGSTQTVIEVDRDDLRFSGTTSPVPGYDRMTGNRTATVSVAGSPGTSCHLLLELRIEDAGDTSIDSAVLLDDIHFE